MFMRNVARQEREPRPCGGGAHFGARSLPSTAVLFFFVVIDCSNIFVGIISIQYILFEHPSVDVDAGVNTRLVSGSA